MNLSEQGLLYKAVKRFVSRFYIEICRANGAGTQTMSNYVKHVQTTFIYVWNLDCFSRPYADLSFLGGFCKGVNTKARR